MQEFGLFTVDDRSAVLTLDWIVAESLERACVQAKRILAETPHHKNVEIWNSAGLLLTVPAQAPERG